MLSIVNYLLEIKINYTLCNHNKNNFQVYDHSWIDNGLLWTTGAQ